MLLSYRCLRELKYILILLSSIWQNVALLGTVLGSVQVMLDQSTSPLQLSTSSHHPSVFPDKFGLENLLVMDSFMALVSRWGAFVEQNHRADLL